MLKSELKNVTMLTIAHRLQTVIHDDKILVMGSGKALEFGSPQDLVQRQGVFYNMVKTTDQEK
jgi:ABC-type multidrug transport system fused ATPase/permease subunit